MAKTVFKELIIFLLLCLAIILVLGILLYDYVPVTKTIPNPVAYTTPDNIKQELATTESVDETQIIKTYQVDATDLNNYRRTQEYRPGKADPFAEQSSSTQSSGSQTDGTNTITNNTGSTTTNTDDDSETTTSGGEFFQDKGTK